MSAASASPGNMLKSQILKPHAKVAESETLGVGPSTIVANPPGDADA